jgi:anti-sigma-K factor RskA
VEEIKAYIESGVLELYVMGELSQSERHEVEKMAAKHPEIKSELAEIEKAVESYANAHAVAPADHLRERIIAGITTKEEAVVVPLQPVSRPSNFYKYAFAASVALLLISWSALFTFYSQLKTSQQTIAELQTNNQRFANQVNFMDKELADSKQALGVVTNPDFKMVKLAGTKNSPSSSILVAFNPKHQDVMIDMTSMKMPANDQEHQLWALVDGKPVDLGVFDMAADSTGMKRMKAIGNAQAFAVTLEKRGGSINPTMDQMMVMGAI